MSILSNLMRLRPAIRSRSGSCIILRQLSQKSDSNLNSTTIKHYALLTTASLAAGFGAYSLGRYLLKPEPVVQPLLVSNLNGPGESLRQHFNFIDKVVKKCASSVVYIEIKDPTKLDPETGQPLTASNGSGFIVRDDGWVLTNAHVVINKPQSMVMVMLQDGSTYQATVESADMNIDLALLKIQSNSKLPYLRLGTSADVATGEWVIALGSPLSLSHSVTAGVISSVNRGAEELGLRNFSMRYIQTDAAITFGNSGGPLVNLDGEVIGINNLRVTAGIAFAIPIDYAKRFLEGSSFSKPNPLALNRETKSFLGITTISVNPKMIDEILQKHQSIPKDVTHGVLVWKVANGTLAQAAGLQVGDIITHINDSPVHTASDIYSVTAASNKRTVKMIVIHNGRKKELTVKRD